MAPAQRIVINIRDTAGERESAQARRTIAHWLVALTVLMVLLGGMFPFDFSSGFGSAISQIHQRFDLTNNDLWRTRENWEKLIFYLPLGFALGSLLWAWRGMRVHQIALRCAIAGLCGAALATTAELSQVFLSRDPALADVIAKSTGSALGFALFVLFGEVLLRWPTRLLISLRKINSPRVFGIAAGVWLIIAVAAPIWVARTISSLGSWEPSYPLLVGNETDGIRFWDGTVSNVWLSAAPASDDELETLLASPNPGQLLNDSLVMAFHFTGRGPYTDASGHTGELAWTGDFNHGAMPGTTEPSDLTGVAAIGRIGVPVSRGWWLRTATGAAAQASDRIAHTGAFTLVLDLAAGTLDQGDGWPRIFSVSKNADECNLRLLQDRADLQLRIRSGATGDGGTDPEFIVPGVFGDTLPQRLVVSYDHGQIQVERSESGERYSIQYLPDAWLVWQIFPISYWHYRMGSPGQLVAVGMYRILVMLPIGMMLGAMLRALGRTRHSHRSQRIFIGGTSGAALVLEVLLHLGAGTPLWVSSPIVSLLAACAGTLLVLGYLPVRRRLA